MDKVPKNIIRVADSLFDDSEEKGSFIESFKGEHSPSFTALIWCKKRPQLAPFKEESMFSWAPDFLTIANKFERPGKSALHEEGYFYAMDVTSSLCGSIFLEIEKKEDFKILDVCAAPGGKSIFAWRVFDPTELISNEVIKKRIPALVSNIKRCSLTNVKVTSFDPSAIERAYKGYFDLVIVDAPCSGQSLRIKGEKAGSPFHPAVINKCAMRQRRIIASSSLGVADGGHLAYFTCTFSKEENEGLVSWFLDRNPQFKAVRVPHLKEFESRWSDFPSYRFFPMKASGAGGFGALLRRDVT